MVGATKLLQNHLVSRSEYEILVAEVRELAVQVNKTQSAQRATNESLRGLVAITKDLRVLAEDAGNLHKCLKAMYGDKLPDELRSPDYRPMWHEDIVEKLLPSKKNKIEEQLVKEWERKGLYHVCEHCRSEVSDRASIDNDFEGVCLRCFKVWHCGEPDCKTAMYNKHEEKCNLHELWREGPLKVEPRTLQGWREHHEQELKHRATKKVVMSGGESTINELSRSRSRSNSNNVSGGGDEYSYGGCESNMSTTSSDGTSTGNYTFMDGTSYDANSNRRPAKKAKSSNYVKGVKGRPLPDKPSGNFICNFFVTNGKCKMAERCWSVHGLDGQPVKKSERERYNKANGLN